MSRTRFIIKPLIQFKYLVIALTVICLTAISVYYSFWSSLIKSAGMECLSSGEWIALQRAYNTSFIWIILIVTLAVGLISTFFFHKIVGPIYVFENLIKTLSSGDFRVYPHSRKNDELKDLAVELQNMIVNISQTVKNDRQSINEVNELIDIGEIVKAKKKLSTVTQWYRINQ